MIRLLLEPATPPMSRAQFCALKSGYSVALDGYVRGGPWFTPTGPWANFNHHEDVDRLATRATCAQVHLAVRQGLFQCFRDHDGPRCDVYANDCDQDVCLAWYVLHNHYRTEPTMNAPLNRLVGLEDMLDTTAGAYPLPLDLPVLGEVAWVFEPYTAFRLAGGLDTRDAHRFSSVVEDVEARIDRHLMGHGGTVRLNTQYKVLRTGGHGPHAWSLVNEVGAQARTGLFADGLRAFVAARERQGGGYVYTVGRMSQFIPFPVVAILSALNEADGILLDARDRWGGSDMVGGSPRIAGSKLSPDDVARVVDGVLAAS